jgi:curved DNA-binding protein CbpA
VHSDRVAMNDRDLYRTLQVDPGATPLVIQAAYRVLAQIWHPDVSGNDEEMKRINAAWEVLGDSKRRAQYDIERAGRHPGSVGQQTPPETSVAGDRRAPRPEDRAGPPPGRPFGPVLQFGRYEGWSLGEIAAVDRPFLEWLRRVPAGRGLGDEIDAILRTRNGRGAVDARRQYETNRRHDQVHAWAPGAPTKIR